jgi:hypothetical protein
VSSRFFRWTPDLEEARDRPLWRDPLRLALAAGAVLLVLAGTLPWAQGLIGLLAVSHSALEGAADGAILVGLAVVLLVLARDRSAADATTPSFRYMPMAVGFACLAVWALGVQESLLDIRHWVDDDGSGALSAGAWVAGIGAAIVALAGTTMSLRPRPGTTAVHLTRPGREVVPGLAAAIGGVAGIILVVVAWLALVDDPALTGLGLMVGGATGGIVGGAAGGAIGRRLAAPPP